MSRFSFPKISILSICVYCLITGIIQHSTVNADGGKKEVLTGQSTCFAVLLKNQEYFPALTKAIDEAKSEIIMSFFLFKVSVNKNGFPEIISAHLAKAAKRGVKIIIVLENSGGNDLKLDADNRQTKHFLEAQGAQVFFDSPQKKTHTKLIVIDQKKIILGSHNLTQSALKYNNEISVLLERPDMARDARNYVLTIIKEAK
jgi:phosphatidylserine/phosphatidylglycerophosphate/cardiolipin synthase-like enzyme